MKHWTTQLLHDVIQENLTNWTGFSTLHAYRHHTSQRSCFEQNQSSITYTREREVIWSSTIIFRNNTKYSNYSIGSAAPRSHIHASDASHLSVSQINWTSLEVKQQKRGSDLSSALNALQRPSIWSSFRKTWHLCSSSFLQKHLRVSNTSRGVIFYLGFLFMTLMNVKCFTILKHPVMFISRWSSLNFTLFYCFKLCSIRVSRQKYLDLYLK